MALGGRIDGIRWNGFHLITSSAARVFWSLTVERRKCASLLILMIRSFATSLVYRVNPSYLGIGVYSAATNHSVVARSSLWDDCGIMAGRFGSTPPPIETPRQSGGGYGAMASAWLE